MSDEQISMTPAKAKAPKPMLDYYLLMISALLLCALGLIMVLSASSAYAGSKLGQPYVFAIRQTIFLIIGLIVALVCSRISPTFLAKRGSIAFVIVFALLFLVAISNRSIGRRGNTNWLSITGQIAIQPSEFAKLGIIIWAAALFAKRIKKIDQPKYLIVPFIPFSVLILALVLVGRDLGTAMVIGFIILAILWFIGTPIRILGLLFGLASALVGILVAQDTSRLNRIGIWLNPASNPDLAGQPTAALYALATGGWWGVGLGASRQKWGGLLDGAHTDFIFAVIGEELGLIGVLSVLALFCLLGVIGLRVALRSDNPFTRTLAGSITAWFFFQASINILVVLNLLPVLGIPLPFISYGGSALVANLAGLGLLLSCARYEPEARTARAAKKRRIESRVVSVSKP